MGVKLFNNDEDPLNDDISKIEINKEYAQRFEHNKKREDLQRYEELKKRGQVEESDEESSDDEDDDFEDFHDPITLRKKDEDFFKALIRVRSRDPRLKEKDVKLFESDDDENRKQEEESEQKEKKGKKAMYLKDVVARHLIEEGPDFQEQDAIVEHKKKAKTYDEEQEEIKKALLDATQEIDNQNDGDFLLVKEKKGKDDEEKEDSSDGEFSKKLEEYFGEDAKMDENTKFLKEFFKNKMWIDKEREGGDLVIDNEVVDEVLRDEEEIERQEGYELEYNFRHEENAEDRVVGYSRKIEGSVRKKESKRKAQRERKEERMRVAEMERQEELKHLKNLKKEEIKERMKKVMEIAGIKKDEKCPLTARDLEEEFDPPKEILALDDKELNQYVSLKKLVPYRDKEWKVPDSKRYQQKLKIKELLKEKKLNGKKAVKKRSRDVAEQSTSRLGDGKEDKRAKLEDSDGDTMNSSKQHKKKRSQASNISESRRKAYGMISSNPKKNKHKH
ncbi:hypothetical protein DITRI_Ditri20bG0092900 [Diplodiscus trichospermus]